MALSNFDNMTTTPKIIPKAPTTPYSSGAKETGFNNPMPWGTDISGLRDTAGTAYKGWQPLASSPTNIVQGSAGVRNDVNKTKATAAQVYKDIQGSSNYADTSAKILDELKKPIAYYNASAPAGWGVDANGKFVKLADGQSPIGAPTANGTPATIMPANEGEEDLPYTTYASTEQAQKDLADQRAAMERQLRIAMGIYTPEEQAQFEAAGQQAGLEYDPLIAEAEAAKREGFGKSTIASGQRGGFMNTQFAGIGALVPTAGGDFAGYGGELEKIKSVYDNNINTLKVRKQQAIDAAKAAAKEAMRTGNSDYLQQARDMYNIAKASHEEAIGLAGQKADLISQYTANKGAKFTYGQAQAEAYAPGLLSYDEEGVPKMPTDDEIKVQADKLGVNFNLLKSSIREQYNQASKTATDYDLKIQELAKKDEMTPYQQAQTYIELEKLARQDRLTPYQQEQLKLEREKMQQSATSGSGTIQATTDQLTLLNSSIQNAKDLAGASGRSGMRRSIESWVVGSTDYTNLVAETNTLRTNVLSLMTDPNIKKFFGPQMSNADVQLMTSAGTTLNPELQSPEKMTEELSRLQNLVDRMVNSLPTGTSSGEATQYSGSDNDAWD